MTNEAFTHQPDLVWCHCLCNPRCYTFLWGPELQHVHHSDTLTSPTPFARSLAFSHQAVWLSVTIHLHQWPAGSIPGLWQAGVAPLKGSFWCNAGDGNRRLWIYGWMCVCVRSTEKNIDTLYAPGRPLSLKGARQLPAAACPCFEPSCQEWLEVTDFHLLMLSWCSFLQIIAQVSHWPQVKISGLLWKTYRFLKHHGWHSYVILRMNVITSSQY